MIETKREGIAALLDQQEKEFSERCSNCGDCLDACPVYPMTKFADKGPRAVMEKVTNLVKTGKIAEEAYDMIFSCTQGCGRICAAACEEGLMPSLCFMALIGKMVKQGAELPRSAYQLEPGHRRSFANAFSALQKRPSGERWIEEMPPDPKPVEVVLFGGCTATGMPHIMLEAMGILDKMGIEFVALTGGSRCCGIGHVICGDVDMSHKAGQNLVSDIAAFRPKQAVFSCLGCYLVLAGTLSLSMDIPFESCELTKFLLDNLERIPFKQSVDKRVALQDSCVLASVPDYFEMPRKLLRAIPGVTLTELENNRENSLCCGGVTKSTRPAIAEKVRLEPLREAEASGTQVLATFCAGCHQSSAPLENDFSFEVRNYISLVAESVGVSHEDVYKRFAGYRDLSRVLIEAKDCIEANDFSLEEMKDILSEYRQFFSNNIKSNHVT